MILVVTKNLRKFIERKRIYWRTKLEIWKKSRSTRSHLRMREAVHVLNRVPTCAKPPAFYPDVISVKKRYFPFSRFTGYKKSNQNQLGRVLPLAFALTCYKIYLNMHHCNVLWCVHVSYGVCRLCAFAQQKTLSSLLKRARSRYFEVFWPSTNLPLNWRKPENNALQRWRNTK